MREMVNLSSGSGPELGSTMIRITPDLRGEGRREEEGGRKEEGTFSEDKIVSVRSNLHLSIL